MLNKKQVINRLAALDLPSDQYLAISGTSLAAHGIRATRDIDIVAKPKLFAKLKQRDGWKEITKFDDEKFLKAGDVDVAFRLHWEGYPTTLEQGIDSADIIAGMPFMNLEEVIKFKQAMGRDKDRKDIQLIKDFLQKND